MRNDPKEHQPYLIGSSPEMTSLFLASFVAKFFETCNGNDNYQTSYQEYR